MNNDPSIHTAHILEGEHALTLIELAEAIQAEHDFILALITHECIAPRGQDAENWRFDSLCLKRARIARSFSMDLGVNMPGIALALDLLAHIDTLKQKP